MIRINTDILILGGGWSGLSAAYLLRKENERNVMILEKEKEIGGLARTINFDGFKYDIGGHRLFFYKSHNIAYLKELLKKDDFIKLKQRIKIYLDGTYIDYPPSFASIFGIRKKYFLPILFDMFFLKKTEETPNFEEWVKANYGKSLFEIYFKDYTEKVWGENCGNLSSAWAKSRIGSNNIYKFLRGVFLSDYEPKEATPFFYYPQNGIGALAESLQTKIKSNTQLFTGIKLIAFSKNNSTLRTLTFMYDNELFEVAFHKVISTIPIQELIAVFPQPTQKHMRDLSVGIKYRSLILVTFILNHKVATSWHWCYFPSKNLLFSRIHEPKFWSSRMAPEGKTCLITEVFCNHNDSCWNMSDEQITKKVEESLLSIGLLSLKSRIDNSIVKRIQYAYPLCYKGYEKPLARVKECLKDLDNLYLAGRSGVHAYYDMEECLENVRATIREL